MKKGVRTPGGIIILGWGNSNQQMAYMMKHMKEKTNPHSYTDLNSARESREYYEKKFIQSLTKHGTNSHQIP